MGVVIVLALVTILTALRTELPRTPGVMSDALGPDPGERVGDYLERAAASLVTVGGGPDVPGGPGDDGDDDEGRAPAPDAHRWALVSAGEAWSVAEAAGAVRGLPRVSGLSVQVPVEGVAMPVAGVALAEPVAGETGREAVFGRGLEQVTARLDPGATASPATPGGSAIDPALDPDTAPAPTDRAAAAAALTASRIRAGEPAIIGLLVRGTTGQLRAVADAPGVRVVEALPPDAVYERFAVRPLLPQQVDAALPLPDDAPVPPRLTGHRGRPGLGLRR
ncbi:hypothetical protein A6035_06545 [Dietzia lutea]|uniref:Uncharacterized protein n=1 Tax=Dietzia lutea TaxID=546160 RepID=A0A2S1RC56_9ACTN|nr:hypothetical protein A6035_06545 [Dietzia lutea]